MQFIVQLLASSLRQHHFLQAALLVVGADFLSLGYRESWDPDWFWRRSVWAGLEQTSFLSLGAKASSRAASWKTWADRILSSVAIHSTGGLRRDRRSGRGLGRTGGIVCPGGEDGSGEGVAKRFV